MQVKISQTSSTQKTLVLEANADNLQPFKQSALIKLAPKVKLKGFRDGKVPPQLAEKEINPEILQAAVLEDLVPKLVTQALKQADIRPVVDPEIKVTKFVACSDLEITVVCDYIPDFKLPDYHKISKTLPKVKVKDAEVDKLLESVLLKYANYKDVPKTYQAQANDQLVIDFTGSDQDGKVIPAATSKDYVLVLGTQHFIKDFEDQLLGAKAGDKLQFAVNFPKDYLKLALAGQTLNFKVDIKEIKQVQLSKLDDNFAQKFGLKSATDFKQALIKEIQIQKQESNLINLQDEVIEDLIKKTTIDIPDSLINKELEFVLKEHYQQLKAYNLEHSDWLKRMKLSEDQHQQRLRQAALWRLKTGLILRTICKQEKLEVSDQEVKAFFESQAKDSKPPTPVQLDNAKAYLLTQKSLQTLMQIILKTDLKNTVKS